MSLRLLTLALLVSTLGIRPDALEGQSVEPVRSFRVDVQRDELVARWIGTREADVYIGEIDENPRFDSPRRWTEDGDGSRTYEQRIPNLRSGTYYLRVRAVETYVVIRQSSQWSHVERVVVGGRDDGNWDTWPDEGNWPDDDRRPGAGGRAAAPGRLDASVSGDDIRVTWTDVRGADRYVLQMDEDRRFGDPFVFSVDSRDDAGAERFTIRNVPRGRWFLRVRAVDAFVARGTGWSPVEVVDVDRGGSRIDRDEVDFRDGRHVRADVNRRGHPVFQEHPGRGRGKGHLKHGDREHSNRDDDWDEGDEDDDD